MIDAYVYGDPVWSRFCRGDLLISRTRSHVVHVLCPDYFRVAGEPESHTGLVTRTALVITHRRTPHPDPVRSLPTGVPPQAISVESPHRRTDGASLAGHGRI